MISNTDEIKKLAKITDYIKTELTPTPQGWVCLSPFTTEKTPSFHIKENDDSQVFKCFSSGMAGDIFSFLMELESKTFTEVYQELCIKFDIQTEFTKTRESQKPYLHLLDKINLNLIFNLTEKSDAMEYLTKERHLTKETISKFKLGWGGDDGGLMEYVHKENLPIQLVKDVGVVGEKDDSFFSIIKNRITIPLFSTDGNVVGISTRKFLESDKYGKYISPPTSPVYKKPSFLYGFNFARQSIKEKDYVILVEGFFDVIKLNQSGIINTVSISGTSVYSGQVEQLKKVTDNFYICLDGDKAGYASIIKNCKSLIKEGLNIFIMELTDNLDPDTFIDIYGKDEFINKINNAKTFLEFLESRGEELIEILEELSKIIPKISSSIKQQYWYQNIENATGIDIRENIKKGYYENQKNESLTYNDTLFLKLYINADDDGKELLDKNKFYETEFGRLLFLKLSNKKYRIEPTDRENEIINSIKSNNTTSIETIEKELKKINELKLLNTI